MHTRDKGAHKHKHNTDTRRHTHIQTPHHSSHKATSPSFRFSGDTDLQGCVSLPFPSSLSLCTLLSVPPHPYLLMALLWIPVHLGAWSNIRSSLHPWPLSAPLSVSDIVKALWESTIVCGLHEFTLSLLFSTFQITQFWFYFVWLCFVCTILSLLVSLT